LDNITDTSLIAYLNELGKHALSPTQLYLLGGSALLLLGNPRPTLDLDYLGDDVKKSEWQLTMESLAESHRIILEAVPIDHFIPLPEGYADRHIFYQRFNNLEVFIFDPYAIAISKIDRGFDSDIDDVAFLIRREYVEPNRLNEMLEKALQYAGEFDLNPATARQHLNLSIKRASNATTKT
jgi:hypothetical protein